MGKDECCGTAKHADYGKIPTLEEGEGLMLVYLHEKNDCTDDAITYEYDVSMVTGCVADCEDGSCEYNTVEIDDACDVATVKTFAASDCSGTATETETYDESQCVLDTDIQADTGLSVYRKVVLTANIDGCNEDPPVVPGTDGGSSAAALSFVLAMVLAIFQL